jgi:hypothetical protein|nr:MAG TPA: hypothetical protein [Caudoviricetes sp.]
MGVKGPIPKRSTEGHRITQARKFEHGVEPVNVIADKVEPPEPDPGWHPIAAKLWESVKQSTFTRYYEPSDWIVLYSACDDLSNYKKQERRSPTMLAAVNTMLTSLLLTEGDRRRVQIEINRIDESEAESAGVTALQAWAKARAAK